MGDLAKRIEILQMAEAQGKPLRPEHQAELRRYREQGIAKGPSTGGADSTEGERKASAFLTRALGSNQSYEQTGMGPRSYVGQTIADIAPNLLNTLPAWAGNSPQRQVADSAQDEFIAASLRQDSGAAIPDPELERQRRIYFPMPGDQGPALQQKRDARFRAISGLKEAAGVSLTPQQKKQLAKVDNNIAYAVGGKAGVADAVLARRKEQFQKRWASKFGPGGKNRAGQTFEQAWVGVEQKVRQAVGGGKPKPIAGGNLIPGEDGVLEWRPR